MGPDPKWDFTIWSLIAAVFFGYALGLRDGRWYRAPNAVKDANGEIIENRIEERAIATAEQRNELR